MNNYLFKKILGCLKNPIVYLQWMWYFIILTSKPAVQCIYSAYFSLLSDKVVEEKLKTLIDDWSDEEELNDLGDLLIISLLERDDLIKLIKCHRVLRCSIALLSAVLLSITILTFIPIVLVAIAVWLALLPLYIAFVPVVSIAHKAIDEKVPIKTSECFNEIYSSERYKVKDEKWRFNFREPTVDVLKGIAQDAYNQIKIRNMVLSDHDGLSDIRYIFQGTHFSYFPLMWMCFANFFCRVFLEITLSPFAPSEVALDKNHAQSPSDRSLSEIATCCKQSLKVAGGRAHG